MSEPRTRMGERPADGARERVTWIGLAHLFVVYLVWGSTYLAIRVAVREEGGFPPFLLGASRTLAASAVLFLWGYTRRHRLRPTRREWKTLIVSGLLMWVGGNGLVNWAEQRADSGYAALLVGALPIWVALVEGAVDRRAPSLRLVGSILIGFAGLAVLTYPLLRVAGRADLLSIGALVLAPLSWGLGSLFQARRPVGLELTTSSAYQQLIGGLGFVIVSLLLREPALRPSGQAWLAWAYLVTAGSLIAFTSFLHALRLLPTRIVMTYSYVNPVIAVFLGWLILQEPITRWTVAGTALVLLGVAGTFRAKRASAPHDPPPQRLPDRC